MSSPRRGPDDLPWLPPRPAESHKGHFGRALLVGGSRGMCGAIALAGQAALRSGAGLVTLAVPEACLDLVASFEPCYMTAPLACDSGGRLAGADERVLELSAGATAVACGPGLGRSGALTAQVCRWYGELPRPLVLDADALNALAEASGQLAQHAGPRILTPHPGEFARLIGRQCPLDQRAALARELALRSGAVVVLKGHRTVVTDGARLAENQTGGPALAAGGMGDVLTGVITALLCQGLDAWEAARLGVHVHGLAGDLAAAAVGPVGLVARDVCERLPAALATVIGPAVR